MINFDFKNSCLIDFNEINLHIQKLIPEIVRIKSNLQHGYNSQYAFINSPKDQTVIDNINKLVKKKLELAPSLLLVIGIGGSNLGAMAIHEAINGKLYNNKNSKLKVYFADTTDSDYISDIYDLMKSELQNGSNVIINVISKSGSTIEAIANFEIFLDLLKQEKPNNFNDYVVITTDASSLLWDYAKKINCSLLEIPKSIGGRFSVLSSVALFPLKMLSIDIDQLLKGADNITQCCLDQNNNIAAISASILYSHYKRNIKIHDIFLFANDLEALGKWYRQLIAESLGKEFNNKNEKVNTGITPTISIGSTDLHSVGQLYLAGPKDKFTTFIDIKKNKNNLKIPSFNEFEKIIPNIQSLNLPTIMNAIITAIKSVYMQKQIPFCSITFNEISEYEIGQFLQFKMFETIYLAYLLEINPFDQPSVELYKKEAKQILQRD